MIVKFFLICAFLLTGIQGFSQDKFYFESSTTFGNAVLTKTNSPDITFLKNSGQSISGTFILNYRIISKPEGKNVAIGSGYEVISSGLSVKTKTAHENGYLSLNNAFVPIILRVSNNISENTELSFRVGYLINVSSETLLNLDSQSQASIANKSNWFDSALMLVKYYGRLGILGQIQLATSANKNGNFVSSTFGIGLGLRIKMI